MIFVLGPCEPLIPMLIVAFERSGTAAVAGVAVSFTVVTVLTMLAIVGLALGGLRRWSLPGLERYQHVVAGLTIFACGASIRFLGL